VPSEREVAAAARAAEVATLALAARGHREAHSSQERLALIVGIRSHAMGAIEADLFVERAMRAARQRLDASRSERQRPELDSSTFRTFGVLSP
jgi:hypothetical protein